MQLVVDNLAVTYELKGKGKLLLLLHGWGDDHRTFKLIAPHLIEKYSLLMLDLPGFGSSQMPNEAWNLDNYAAFIAAFLNKLKLKPYAVIGHSNGGALAIRGLAMGSLKADKLVLLASAGIRNTHPIKRAVTKSVAKIGKATTFWAPKETKTKLRQKLYGTVGSDMLVAPHLEETFKLTVAQDVRADAARLKLPTLIVNARYDPAIPLSDGQLLNSLIKGSTLAVLSSSNHFIHQELSIEVAKLILDFL